ncbi:hypothetical protein GCM10010377_00730 [Streptomyces viridiviolaceus]|uniref:DUF4132 domain-containing protein n=1 Tax=Streptomyces viridiviolaceus TaxID=68282 RepID=A0ABW2E0U9_9ACTN|nr:DUF4132 domain-containing protein [Streptomyces viridiviolaceus]GHB15392.1 hypothetical protein GCM10010377_00730 [Streptomyces viridiviolaceus]
MGWLAAGDSYEVALVEGRVVARSVPGESPAGQGRGLPAEIRDRPEVHELQRFAEWLERHAAECATQVDTWMVSSLPVPTVLLAQVWPDEAWQAALRDIVVVGDGPDEVGFLRDADGSGVLRVVNLDGETVRLAPRTVTMPHPVLLPELEELRAFAADLGVTQGVEQIHRATWHKPGGIDPAADRVTEFAGAEYRSWFHLSARVTSLGYKVSGSSATDRIRDGGRTFTAAVGMSDPFTEEKAWTGSLTWSDQDGQRLLPLTEVGPVAWSEGMRMAAALHAGRTVTADGAE